MKETTKTKWALFFCIAWLLMWIGAIFWAMFIAATIFSCNTVHKTETDTTIKTDSSHVVKQNKNRWKDSSGSIRKQQLEKWKKKTVIEYDTSKPDYPEFTEEQGGPYVHSAVWSTAGNRYKPLKVTITESGSKQKSSDQSVAKSDGATENVTDSAHVKKQESTTAKTKKKFSFHLWQLIFLAIPLLIYFYRNKIINFFKHRISPWQILK